MICHWRAAEATLLLAGALALATSVEARDKTDVIEVKNGDRLHGEILTLEFGQLKFKTDSLGTLYVEWPDVVAIESEYRFYVESLGGRRHFGSLRTGESPGELLVSGTGQSQSFQITDVTRIDQVEQSFLDRIDGSFSVGFNYAKSTNISATSAHFQTRYRSQLNVGLLTADLSSTTSEGDSSDRLNVSYNHQYLRPQGRFIVGGASFERNDELGIEGRLQVFGGYGRYVRQTSFSEVGIFGGVALNQEWISGDEDAQQTMEGVLGSNWRIFRFSSPETSLTSSLVLYPGLSEWGRYRSDVNVSLRRELIEDLFLDLSVYYSYDNEPPSEDAAKDDYGVVTSLGYSF